MAPAWRITLKDMLLRLRDRSAIIIGIVVPLALSFIFNAVFGGAFGDEALTTVGFVDADGGAVAAGLGEALRSLNEAGTIAVEELPDQEDLRDRLEEGELAAGIVVPTGFGESVLSGRSASLIVLEDVDSPTAASIARGIAAGFASSVEDAERAVQAAVAAGESSEPARLAAIAEAAATTDPLVEIGTITAADKVLDPTTFYSAGMAVFFLFFLVQVGVTGLIDEERDGTLTRLQAAPIPRWSIVTGKAMTSVLLGMVALTVLAVTTTLLLGADWGDPLGLALLFAVVTLAATSLLGIVGALARTPEGAGNLVAVIAVSMGMLGGTFFPIGLDNRILELASLATPHSWFMRGIGDLRTGDALAAAPSFVALGTFTLVAGTVAAALMARRYR